MARHADDAARPEAAGSESVARRGLTVAHLVDLTLACLVIWLLVRIAGLFLAPAIDPGAAFLVAGRSEQLSGDTGASPRFQALEGQSPFLKKDAAKQTTANLPVTKLNVTLLGIRLAESGASSAILKTAGAVEAAFGVGEEIMPGVRIAGIYVDHIVLSRGGRQERLFLDGEEARTVNR